MGKLFISFGFQGAAFGTIGIIINLFVVVGLGGNVAMASIALALYTAGNLIGSMIIGTLLDKYPYFFESIFLSIIADAIISSLMAFTQNIEIYYVLALFLGIFAAIMGPAITIYLNRQFDESGYRKSINRANMVNSIGATVGTFLGGFWLYLPFFGTVYQMRSVFIIGTVLLIISSIFAMGNLRSRKIPKIDINVKSHFFSFKYFVNDLISSFSFSGMKSESKKYMFILFLLFFGLNMIFSIFAIYFNEILKISSSSIFIIYGINSIFGNIAYLLTEKMMNRFKDSILVRWALWVRLSMFVMIIFSYFFMSYGGVMITIIAFLITGLAWPFIYIPITVKVTNLALPTSRGKAIGMFNMVINFAAISASLFSGYIALTLGYILSFAFATVLLFFVERELYLMNKNTEKD